MNLVFVNHVDPRSGLVSGLRLWRFAQELAQRGHRVLFLCEARDAAHASDPAALAGQLGAWDGAAPLLIGYGAADAAHRHRGRDARAGVLGRAVTAWDLVVRGGVFWRWRAAVAPALPAVRDVFKPDAIVTTFGNLDCIALARSIARVCGAPWLLDIKDPMRRFVPRTLWGLLRRRCASAATITFNSRVLAEECAQLYGFSGDVIYSGADRCTPSASNLVDYATKPIIQLIGSVRSEAHLRDLLTEFGAVAAERATRGEPVPVLRYYGADRASVVAASDALGVPVEAQGQLAREELLARCVVAAANAYTSSDRYFHHKLLELLAAGAPVIAYPSERAESLDLAAAGSTPLYVCPDAAALRTALAAACDAHGQPRPAPVDRYDWGTYAAELERHIAAMVAAAQRRA